MNGLNDYTIVIVYKDGQDTGNRRGKARKDEE